MSETARPTVVVTGAGPEAAAHLRARLNESGAAGVFAESWPPAGAPGQIAAVVVWAADAAGAAAAVRRLTAAPLLIVCAELDAQGWRAGLDAGADVCLPASAPAAVIAAQLAALLRARPAAEAPAPATLACGQLVLDPATRHAESAGVTITLNRREFDLLAHLLRHRGQVMARHELLSAVWGAAFMGDSNTVDVHVAWLRQKLPAGCGVRITTLRGLGYRLDELTAVAETADTAAPPATPEAREGRPAAPRGSPARTSRRGR